MRRQHTAKARKTHGEIFVVFFTMTHSKPLCNYLHGNQSLSCAICLGARQRFAVHPRQAHSKTLKKLKGATGAAGCRAAARPPGTLPHAVEGGGYSPSLEVEAARTPLGEEVVARLAPPWMGETAPPCALVGGRRGGYSRSFPGGR